MIRYQCPNCAAVLVEEGGALVCPRDGYRNVPCGGIRDFLSADRARAHAGFLEEYRAIRDAEGRGSDDAALYLVLPSVPDGRADSKEWAMRAESMRWLREALGRMNRGAALRVLDAGAGNCWLTRRLAEWGHEAIALDLNLDERDGLAAGRHYLEALPLRFERVRSEYERLPFAAGSFDAVVFNGAVHYADDLRAVLAEACRVTVPGGAVIIIDSPIYSDFSSGMKMRAEREVKGRAGFLTFSDLGLIADELGLELHVDIPQLGALRRLKRRITEFRMSREIATMGRVTLTVPGRNDE